MGKHQKHMIMMIYFDLNFYIMGERGLQATTILIFLLVVVMISNNNNELYFAQ